MTLSSVLRRRAARTPDAEAVVSGGRRVSYRQLDHGVDAVSGGLLALGVEPGHRVAAWLSNRVEYLEAYLACSRVGATFVPLNPRLARAEASAILEDAGASVLVLEGHYEGTSRLDGIADLEAALRPPAAIVNVDEAASPPRRAPDAVDLRRLEANVGPDGLALVVYTSGTTGRPKGVMLTHGGLAAYARGAIRTGLFGPGDRVLVQVPLSTTAGSVIQTVPTLHAGGTLVLLGRFEAEASLRAIGEERITCSVAPPTILALQLAAPGFGGHDLSSLGHVITGAAPVPRELAARVVSEMGTRITNSYGATETGGLVTYLPTDASEEKAVGTCGVAIPGYEIRLVDGARAEVAPGETGEIAVRGPSVTRGYFRAEDETRAAIADGWWFSGDLGRFDEDGFLCVVGRKKDMYIRGGFNVYPAEVEAALQGMPGVVACAVTGFGDPVLGEKGRAFVVGTPGCGLTADAIREFCRSRIADYKAPDDVVFVDALPLIGPGKVDRARLDELHATVGAHT